MKGKPTCLKKKTVIDFFCGAGGFSEGFQQAGVEIVSGFDNWQPAINTYNFNFGNKGILKNIEDFWNSLEEIEMLPNTDFIIGSPPCTSFSLSNKSGKVDKKHGKNLILSFLRVVAVKKHQKKSKLTAWYMENVVNSKNYLKDHYTFNDLNLSEWAKKNRIDPKKIAIQINGNCRILNSANYGGLQNRSRLIISENKLGNTFIEPPIIHQSDNYRKLEELFHHLPSPLSERNSKLVKDPNYTYSISAKNITDHFYDTGIYEIEWKMAKFKKTNHPFMGPMSFPEKNHRPSRTILANNIIISREALLYKCEQGRIGDGEYRTPTIREAACLMSFDLGYQFIGTESQKWRLVGNAVCPCLSKVLAASLLNCIGYKKINYKIKRSIKKLINPTNINSYTQRNFNIPRKKNKNSKFKMHISKKANMTVSLSNYNPLASDKKIVKEWHTTIQYGLSRKLKFKRISKEQVISIEKEILNHSKNGKIFMREFDKLILRKTPGKKYLQELYENQVSTKKYFNPGKLIEISHELISRHCTENDFIATDNLPFIPKANIPTIHLYSMYAIAKIAYTANESF